MSTIEDQIIPRLVLAHAPAQAVECPDGRLPPTAQEVAQFTERAAAQDMASLLSTVEQMSRDGLSLQTLLLELIAPAARLLGEEWLDDTRSFAEVTVALGTLQRVVAVLGHNVDPPLSHKGLVVLVAAPGEQHTLAIHILGELLRQAGWGAHVDASLHEEELLDLVASEPVVMVGISASSTASVPLLARTIANLKRASMNPNLVVMLGGARELEAKAPSVGATYCASAREALEWLARCERRDDGSAVGPKLPG